MPPLSCQRYLPALSRQRYLPALLASTVMPALFASTAARPWSAALCCCSRAVCDWSGTDQITAAANERADRGIHKAARLSSSCQQLALLQDGCRAGCKLCRAGCKLCRAGCKVRRDMSVRGGENVVHVSCSTILLCCSLCACQLLQAQAQPRSPPAPRSGRCTLPSGCSCCSHQATAVAELLFSLSS